MAHLFVKFLPATDFSGPYKGNFDMKLGFSGLSDDFKFWHKLKHLEFNWTIEEGSLNVVDKTIRVIMMLLYKFPVCVSLFDRNAAMEKNYLICLKTQSVICRSKDINSLVFNEHFSFRRQILGYFPELPDATSWIKQRFNEKRYMIFQNLLQN